MRNDGMRSGDVLSFIFRPTPSPWLFSICLLELFPRPRAEGGAGGERSAAAGGMMICLLPIMSCRSLAIARSLLRFGSPCGVMLLGLFYFAIKAFQCGGLAGRLIASLVVPLACSCC